MDQAWRWWERREEAATTLYLALANEPMVCQVKASPAVVPRTIHDLQIVVRLQGGAVWLVPIDEAIAFQPHVFQFRCQRHWASWQRKRAQRSEERDDAHAR